MSVWSSANKICQCLNLAWLHSNSTENSIFSTEWFSFSLPKFHRCVHVICFVSCSGIFDSGSFDCTMSVICRICSGSLLFVYSIRHDLLPKQVSFLPFWCYCDWDHLSRSPKLAWSGKAQWQFSTHKHERSCLDSNQVFYCFATEYEHWSKDIFFMQVKKQGKQPRKTGDCT